MSLAAESRTSTHIFEKGHGNSPACYAIENDRASRRALALLMQVLFFRMSKDADDDSKVRAHKKHLTALARYALADLLRFLEQMPGLTESIRHFLCFHAQAAYDSHRAIGFSQNSTSRLQGLPPCPTLLFKPRTWFVCTRPCTNRLPFRVTNLEAFLL